MDTSTSTSASTADSADARLTAARRFLAAIPVIDDWVAQVAAYLSGGPEQRARLREGLVPHGDQIEAVYAAAMIRHYSAAEIDALAAFQASPLGRSIAQKQGKVQGETIAALTPLLQRVVEDVLRAAPAREPGS